MFFVLLVSTAARTSYPVCKRADKASIYNAGDSLPNNFVLTPVFEFPSASLIESKRAEHFKYAIKYGLSVEMIEDLSLFRFIDEWYGVKYRFGGTTKQGIDCSAFTRQLVKDLYCLDIARVVGDQYRQCTPISKDELKQGDLVFFETFQPGLSHVAVYIGENKFVHASSNKGITIDDFNNSYYKRNYRKSGRLIRK
jgi:hypothetical protein